MSNLEQKTLLRIVRSWKINKKPEYRGFRCANCQKYIYKSWHYWLKRGGYQTPVHFCNKCQVQLRALKNKAVYKTFACDNCGKKMSKAYHVWNKKNEVLSESHFCKNCGSKLGFGKRIKGIIYDLDGTIISTVKLHEAAWLYAGKKFSIPISNIMLIKQKGISNKAAALMMIPKSKRNILDRFVNAKQEYVKKNINKITAFPEAITTIYQLLKRGYKVWICTSARKEFVLEILDILKSLKKIIKNNFVWREMYEREKPSPEALNLVEKRVKLTNSRVCYIGDAFSDYQMSKAAKVKFIYFCPSSENPDLRIPKSVPIISLHKEIFKFLKQSCVFKVSPKYRKSTLD